MIPAEIGHPVRICSLAHVWEHLPSIDGIDKGQLFELHAHHVTISSEGPSVSCVVVHHDEGPIAGGDDFTWRVARPSHAERVSRDSRYRFGAF